jgi:acetoin:2,6-dichlorophenolindophenol oxidoreductase subunit alpha
MAEHELGLNILRQMLLIRCFEEQLVELYERGLIVGHYHVYIGQEATGVAAIAQLAANDTLFTTHRNHGHLLARGADPARLMAEILGRATGLNGGRSGTLHPVDPGRGVLHTSAIVAGCLPVACGAAFSAKRAGNGQVAAVFFGDGAMEEGAFYEALNLAALWRLPLILVCENNSIPPDLRSAGQYPSSTHAARQLVEVADAFNVPSRVVDGANVEAVSDAMAEAVARAREQAGPTFIEARASRWPGNFGLYPKIVGGPTEVRWAWQPESAPSDLRTWAESSDPILLWLRTLLERKTLSQADAVEMQGQVREQVRDITQQTIDAPWPDAATVLEGVLA